MCRLLAFKSSIPTQIHQALHDAENAMVIQSRKHQDGWGVGFYVGEELFVVKRAYAAFKDFNFPQLTKAIVSHNIVCHVRRATVGMHKKTENCHPFRFGKILCAHNGTIQRFKAMQLLMLNEISQDLHKHILGDTDSEYVFHLFLTYLLKETDEPDTCKDLRIFEKALIKTIKKIDELCINVGAKRQSSLNFIITNGHIMLATCRGRELYYTEHHGAMGIKHEPEVAEKRKEIEKYFLISSEKISKSEYWEKVPDNALIMVDDKVNFDVVPL
ncbi:MAG: class II glutamine amidotransferase [Deltaproteobacteria bacterium]|nr:class II glutamine amidotransferase [Deltaproteobacteria bacterium]